uniref:4-hydroxy-3-methylbut-2-en-1-yl diphosphate synthase (flavodoxin) n=1 Tax=candidate division WOR-3 bacterium TaxID=2052148 RepID=A0A7C4GHN8_UNCW3
MTSRRRAVSAPKPRRTRSVCIGPLTIGGGAPIAVQSMTTTRTDDVKATLRQIRRLENAGCEIVRLAVPDEKAAAALPAIRDRTALPLVADIHFDYRLALAAIRAGFDKVRINPGNIGPRWKLHEVIAAAADAGVAVRIGVNAGSIEKRILKKHRRPTPAALVESLAACIEPFARLGFENLVLSAKTASVPDLIETCRTIARNWDYPQHLGLTEAGLPFEGAIRSAAALGVLLHEGIGDTIRISLAGDPVREVEAAWELLAALGRRRRGPVVIACPTCGRTGIDVVGLARRLKSRLRRETRPLKIAVMGCVVNGPGEAREADYGICGGRGKGVVFSRGRVVCTCRESELLPALLRVIRES